MITGITIYFSILRDKTLKGDSNQGIEFIGYLYIFISVEVKGFYRHDFIFNFYDNYNWVGPKVDRTVQQEWWIDWLVLQNWPIDSVYFCAFVFNLVFRLAISVHRFQWCKMHSVNRINTQFCWARDSFILRLEGVASFYVVDSPYKR